MCGEEWFQYLLYHLNRSSGYYLYVVIVFANIRFTRSYDAMHAILNYIILSLSKVLANNKYLKLKQLLTHFIRQ